MAGAERSSKAWDLDHGVTHPVQPPMGDLKHRYASMVGAPSHRGQESESQDLSWKAVVRRMVIQNKTWVLKG